MNTPEVLQGASEQDPLAKYGLRFAKEEGSIVGPKKPRLYAETPAINLAGKTDLTPRKAFLKKAFQNNEVSLLTDKEELLEVVGKVFTAATTRQLRDYAHMVFVDRQDWAAVKPNLVSPYNEGKDFNGINFGGLILIEGISDNHLFPISFHELGHSLYPPANVSFTDELRAYYFQKVCTEILQRELRQIGLSYSYPPLRQIPSKSHEEAYQWANAVYAHRSQPELHKQVNPQLSEKIQAMARLIRPPDQHLKGWARNLLKPFRRNPS